MAWIEWKGRRLWTPVLEKLHTIQSEEKAKQEEQQQPRRSYRLTAESNL